MAKRLLLPLVFFCSLSAAPAAGRAADAPRDGLAALYDRMASDLRAGRPLVIQAHVALCDNSQVRCGGRGLGDGESLAKNLYWATSGGLVGWFSRRGAGWREVQRLASPEADVLEVRVYSRSFAPDGALRARGLRRPFTAYVVAYAWRGEKSSDAFAAFAADLLGDRPRVLATRDGAALAAGGAAHAVAYIGHNRLMDLAPAQIRAVLDQPRVTEPQPKGLLAVACWTVAYLHRLVAAERTPLLLTADLLFAGSHAFEGATTALLRGATLAEVRDAGAGAYASGQGKTLGHVRGAFTNPADPRWPRFLARFSGGRP